MTASLPRRTPGAHIPGLHDVAFSGWFRPLWPTEDDSDDHERKPGDETWRGFLLVGVGNDDTVDQVAEAEFDTVNEARAWVQRELPRAQLPGWAHRRPHGPNGAFLYGTISHGWYTTDMHWEPAATGEMDADLIDGRIRWVARTYT